MARDRWLELVGPAQRLKMEDINLPARYIGEVGPTSTVVVLSRTARTNALPFLHPRAACITGRTARPNLRAYCSSLLRPRMG